MSRIAPRAASRRRVPHVTLSALLASSLLAFPAIAEPLALNPAGYAAAPTVRVAARGATGNRLGGGFIEYLFGDNAAARERYEREPDPYAASAVAAVDPSTHEPLDPIFLPQTVAYDSPEKPGTIVIDTPRHFLYLVQPGGTARRYGIGVGRPGFTWAGVKEISAKREWPDWRPPDEMLRRRPDLPTFMAGGPENPLGARAMYLGSSLYRIHGSNEPWTIGTAVSSGCVRMRNEDVIDLYERVKVGTRVIVI
jgi:lipoprotein-anchoring transpeptidase ErfK/SrfK